MSVQTEAAAVAKEAYWAFVQLVRPSITREDFERQWAVYLQLTGRNR